MRDHWLLKVGTQRRDIVSRALGHKQLKIMECPQNFGAAKVKARALLGTQSAVHDTHAPPFTSHSIGRPPQGRRLSKSCFCPHTLQDTGPRPLT